MEGMIEDRSKAALVGLLHNVDTFAWRAGQDTALVERLVPDQWQAALSNRSPRQDRILALADRLATGVRGDRGGKQPKRLLSIFCQLQACGKGPPAARYLPLRSLAIDEEVLFPTLESEADDLRQAYRALWDDFARDAARLKKVHSGEKADLETYLASLQMLLHRYTWCIPSAYDEVLPDVSLYDHSRMTAALAVCLIDQQDAVIDTLLSGQSSDAPLAVLIGGDLSGVQAFIYTITSRGATSALRGRSFYLQLLNEAVYRYVLRRLGLPLTNLIYGGGGHFYLLACPQDDERLREIQREVSCVLLAHHQGDLYLAIEGKSLAAMDFYDGRISGKWEALSRALREAKQRRFVELKDDLALLFEPQGHGGNQDAQCQVCGREHPGTEPVDGVRKCPPCCSYEDLGDSLRHARYLWLERRESAIPQEPLDVEPGQWSEVLVALGLRADIETKAKDVPNSSDGHRAVLALRDDALADLHPSARTAVGRRLLVNVTPLFKKVDAQWLARQPESIRRRLYEELPLEPESKIKPFALLEAQSAGIKRLGVLRMDVDDLGAIFNEGFGQNATLSRVAALSLAISLYFEGWVEYLAESLNEKACQEGRGDVLYSIYSGGDDLFFVGAWDAVVELARLIRADLGRFAAKHAGIHASAGAALVGGKYPLYQAAVDAGAAEGKAKDLRWRDGVGEKHRKDAVTFLDRALPWQFFGLEACEKVGMETAHALAHRLVKMVKSKQEGGEGAPQTLLQRLTHVQEMYEEASVTRRKRGEDLNVLGEEQVYWGPWMWRGQYFLMRLAGKKEGEPWKSIRTLAESLTGDRFRAIEWIGLAARWADLLTR